MSIVSEQKCESLILIFIVKLLGSRHMNSEAIVNLMNPGINIEYRGNERKPLLHTLN